MRARQRRWPRVWLMTDERMGERLWAALERLPDGAGVVFRHYSLPRDAREELAARVADLARPAASFWRLPAIRSSRCVTGDPKLALRLGAELVHNPEGSAGALPFSRSVHSVEEAKAARVEGAALVFVSPVNATRSHPGQEPLGRHAAGRIARTSGVPAIALGGMDSARFALLEREGFHGWAGIDAWL
jgi:thiamine-phosphate pyrophosphorylase